jgi:catechol 2,3-dioxygenase-like lactoylglutathione lyase family enzyme
VEPVNLSILQCSVQPLRESVRANSFVVVQLHPLNYANFRGGEMENLIAKLLDDFDHGRMTRRQLIKSLAVVGAAAAGTTTALGDTPKGFKVVAVNHISYQVNDYAKTRDFYADLLGMKVVGDNGKQCNLILGDTNTFVIPRNAPQGTTPPRIDHVAYTIENWDKNAVKAELDRRGLNPQPDTDNSFHVKDPNGYDLQICGKDMKPA